MIACRKFLIAANKNGELAISVLNQKLMSTNRVN